MTPITVSGTPFSVIVAPIADGSPLKRRCHVWCVITTTGFTVPGALSSSVKKRPRSGFQPQHVEKRSGRKRADETLRFVHAGQVDALWKEQADRVDDAAASGSPRIRRYESRPRGNAVRLAPDVDQPIGVRIRQRPQQHGVDDAEHRGVGADAERQRQDRDERRTPAAAARGGSA